MSLSPLRSSRFQSFIKSLKNKQVILSSRNKSVLQDHKFQIAFKNPACNSIFTRKIFQESNSQSSFSEEETDKFSALSPRWWDPHGEMKALHSMNEVRIPFIRDCLLYQGYNEGKPFTADPLKGLDILEVGCGGGIVSESLARLGASVVGIDSSEEAINAAKQHRSEKLTNLQYICALVEDMASIGSVKFDAVVASEVLEHVENQSVFVETCSSSLKPAGSLFISTVNRTAVSYALAIIAAEKFFKVAPDGAHDWQKFVTVEELTDMFIACQCHVRKIHGMLYNPFCNTWQFVENTDMNFIVHAIKDSP